MSRPGSPQGSRQRRTLSPRQRQVLDLMAAGLVRKQVAEKLKLSVRTVDHHVKIIYLKLNARNAAHAVALVKA